MSRASRCTWRQDVPGVRIPKVSCLASGRSRQDVLLRILPYYRPKSRGRKLDQCGATPNLSGAQHYKILCQFEAENANFIRYNCTCKYDTDSAKSKSSDYFTANFQVKENKTKMRNIHPRFFHSLFRG